MRPIIRPHTDPDLGHCSYLNTCYGEVRRPSSNGYYLGFVDPETSLANLRAGPIARRGRAPLEIAEGLQIPAL